MPNVHFSSHFEKHIKLGSVVVEGDVLSKALESIFMAQPALRSYVLDDQGCVRRHVMIFLDDQPIRDRKHLSDPVAPTSEIYVFQALSGG
jgi:sulfur-carrier protein